MKKKAEKPIKSRGRPRLRADCKYVEIGISVPAWMARKLSNTFLEEKQSSRVKLIEWYLAKCLGYNKKSYVEKCEEEAQKESKGK